MRIINAIHVVVHTLSASRLCLAAVLVWGGLGSPLSAEVVLQTKHLCLRIAADGTVASLTAKPAGTEYRAASPCPLAIVCRGGRMVPASEGKYAAVTGRWVYRGGSQLPAAAVTRQGDLLHVEFGQAHARATYRLRCTDDYLAFELLGVEGQSIDRIEFLRLDLRRLPYLGQWMGALYDDRFGICLCGGNAETNIEMLPRDGDVRLTAAAEARVALRGPTAVLFGCQEPKTRLLDVMARVEQDFHLSSGVAARRSPLQRLSFLWAANPTPQNIDQYIHWAKLGGFRVLLFSYTAFSRGAGHYLWNDSYPHGMADIYRQTGPYAMVYFDGAEDVHEPFWYHVALAQHRVFRRLDPPPAVCESAQYTRTSVGT